MGRARAYAWVLAVLVIGAFPAVAQAAAAPNPSASSTATASARSRRRPIRPLLAPTLAGRGHGRFYEHGHYIGHDEPSVRYISNTPGSGADVTYVERLGKDPAQLPTVRQPGDDVTHFFELSVAPWFSMDLCDPNSSPLTALHAGLGHECAHGVLPRRRQRVHGAPVLPARLRAVLRQHQLRQQALVLGSEYRQPRVQRRSLNVQRQLRGAGQLRLHPAQRRSHRAAEPSGVGSGDVYAERRHAADEARRHDRHPHLRCQAERGWSRAGGDRGRRDQPNIGIHDRVGRQRLHEHQSDRPHLLRARRSTSSPSTRARLPTTSSPGDSGRTTSTASSRSATSSRARVSLGQTPPQATRTGPTASARMKPRRRIRTSSPTTVRATRSEIPMGERRHPTS